jgi:hypothetical protein
LAAPEFVGSGKQEESMFFFEKKNQKTFVCSVAKLTKAFCFFFSKKKPFCPLLPNACAG